MKKLELLMIGSRLQIYLFKTASCLNKETIFILVSDFLQLFGFRKGNEDFGVFDPENEVGAGGVVIAEHDEEGFVKDEV
jgi:hypothetical protein